jgi:hypothetical protein
MISFEYLHTKYGQARDGYILVSYIAEGVNVLIYHYTINASTFAFRLEKCILVIQQGLQLERTIVS